MAKKKNAQRQTAAKRIEQEACDAKIATLNTIKLKARQIRKPIKNPWGEELFLRRVPGKQGVSLIKQIESLPVDESGDPEIQGEAIETICCLMSLVLVNANGDPIFDNPDGRSLLAELDLGEILALFREICTAAEITPGQAEKNEPSPSGDSA